MEDSGACFVVLTDLAFSIESAPSVKYALEFEMSLLRGV